MCKGSACLANLHLTSIPLQKPHACPQHQGNTKRERGDTGNAMGKQEHLGAAGKTLGGAERPRGASRCRPLCLINSSQVAPNHFHLKSSKTRGRGERLPTTKEAMDTDLTPTEVYLVSARPTTISSLIPSELGSHYSPRDSVNNQYHHNEPGN